VSIPKIVHLSWKQKDIFDNQAPLILNGIRNLKDQNPDWSIGIHDDNDVDLYLRENLAQLDYELIRGKKMVEKTDLWRLLKVYNEGGLYTDIDRYYNIPLSELVTDGIRCVLPTCVEWDFSQDFMLSAPQNPIYKEAIELNLQRRRAGHHQTYFLGPQTYMHAVTKVLMGRVIDTNPGVEEFQRIREALAQYPFIRTYREELPNNTIVFRRDEAAFKLGNGKSKEEFYAECGVRHWLDE